MKELGIDRTGHQSKSVDELSGQFFDHVVTVCDNARDNCPVFPSNATRNHWSFDYARGGTRYGRGSACGVPPHP